MRGPATILAATLLAACGGGAITGDGFDGGVDGAAAVDAATTSGTAPPGAVPGEIVAGDQNDVDVPAGGAVTYRVETDAGEHVAFRLDFAVGPGGVKLRVFRWDGARPVELGVTDGGAGLRVLAVVDQGGPRTFWARVEAADALTGTLSVTRTPFTEGLRCDADCDHLLQLPLPNDPAIDGYDISQAVFRYEFGRRDLVMFVREAGRELAASGEQPFRPEDLSDWLGRTPGEDVGAPRHASHQRGKDVDLSLYGTDGAAPWRSYCTTQITADGRECIAGTEHDLDPERNARMFAVFYATGRVTMCFLDQELIAAVVPGAEQAVADGLVSADLLPLYSDGVHLMHWPNHDNHIHVRVSETALVRSSFEAP